MDKMEQLWAYMREDIKADKIENEIRNSPLRQKLEKTRDYILNQQNAYKQIEEQVSVRADRKDAIRDALKRSEEQLSALESRFEAEPPEDLESAKKMLAEVDKCRKTIVSYEQEMRRLSKESNDFDNKTTSIRHGAAKAKQEFDRMKLIYNEESKAKKEELEAQRAVARSKAEGIPEELMAVYNTVKRQISPPMAKLYGGQCTGCNTSQPSAALRKIDVGNEIVECETCGRILIKLD